MKIVSEICASNQGGWQFGVESRLAGWRYYSIIEVWKADRTRARLDAIRKAIRQHNNSWSLRGRVAQWPNG